MVREQEKKKSGKIAGEMHEQGDVAAAVESEALDVGRAQKIGTRSW
jgi:hypothetical protein